MEKAGLLDLAIAPLRWLERARGWRRLGIAALYLILSAIGGVFGWRELSLWRLPSINEPFDTVKYGTLSIADADNAMVDYREAAKRFIPGNSSYRVASFKAWNGSDWATADPEVLRWVSDNQVGFEIWLRGTERPDALLVQPKDLDDQNLMAPIGTSRTFAKMAVMHGSRLDNEGDLEGAWRMYRAVLRSSRHVGRHGGFYPRFNGQLMLAEARPSIKHWLNHPKMTPAMLRRAIIDVEESSAMTSPVSEMVRAEYFAFRSSLSRPQDWQRIGLEASADDASWYYELPFMRAIERFFQHEPERSLRVHRLITAGLLAQCDRPAADQPQLFSTQFRIYNLDARTPEDVASISPQELTNWAKKSAVRGLLYSGGQAFVRIQAERGIFDDLRLALAERAYEIERGKPPANYRDLLGDYLKALPEGFEPGDAISATDVPNPQKTSAQ